MSFFKKVKIAEKISVQKCDYCIGKKRTQSKTALYKIFQVEDKTLFLCRDCFIEFEKTHDVKLKKVVDFSSNPLNLPDETFLIEIREYWKSFREFGEEKYLDFRKSPGFDWIFMQSNFRDYLELDEDTQKEFQFDYKFSNLSSSIPLVILDWKNDEKIGYSHEGEVICKIFPNKDILFYHR